MAERRPIQTAAILICLTGKRGDNLPLQPFARGSRGEAEGGVVKKKKKRKKERESKGRRAELNSDKGVG